MSAIDKKPDIIGMLLAGIKSQAEDGVYEDSSLSIAMDVEEAEAELAELQVDRERLRWLIKHGAIIIDGIHKGKIMYYVRYFRNGICKETDWHDTPRAAIDAAREGEPKIIEHPHHWPGVKTRIHPNGRVEEARPEA